MIRVVLPGHLKRLAKVEGEVALEVAAPVTPAAVMDALEAAHPALVGTLRDHVTKKRRPLVRFFACNEDVTQQGTDAPLPDAIANGEEPLLVVGAIAGGAG